MIIGCDVGLKRIGLAGYISGIILPFEPILRKNRNQASQEVTSFLHSKNAEKLIVGIPDKNTCSDTYARITHFIGLLAFGGEIIYVNEDFSSAEAFEHLLHMGRKSRKQAQKDGKLDSLAACEILQRYVESL
ncbi:Holliday junction resolvase RuvX [Helicobacter sp. 11S02596-1]|uniref:Holliday junction resolvase RuvX n=1 Tax=Helicobacter sp. 11S02596-1 TaxID=1476194 RepID=UPI000BA54C00|nr:Holliday junction resolvase RuvX [Helicobacter sp. 11S02596-1]PAF44868.1 Holliday junction DNA helicase RuvA [Helicobacter sp. 11S02596-1]